MYYSTSNGMLFPHKDGRNIPVKERTMMQIRSYMKKYRYDFRKIGDYWGFVADYGITYKYLGGQSISKCNGNIYAEFECVGVKTYGGDQAYSTLCIADYEDYIHEIEEVHEVD